MFGINKNGIISVLCYSSIMLWFVIPPIVWGGENPMKWVVGGFFGIIWLMVMFLCIVEPKQPEERDRRR
jgi:hypothetical protein